MSTTTVRQLIESLEEIAAEYGDDTQVLAAHQPNYPLAERLACVVSTLVLDDEIVEDALDDDDAEKAAPVAWLVLAGHPDGYGDCAWSSPYASSALWDDSVGTAYSL